MIDGKCQMIKVKMKTVKGRGWKIRTMKKKKIMKWVRILEAKKRKMEKMITAETTEEKNTNITSQKK